MRHLTIALLAMGLMTSAMASEIYADESASAACHVLVHVVPNVAINPLAPQVEVQAIQSDEFDVVCEFQIQANTQVLELSVQASSLYKHDDPNSPYFIPLKSGSDTVEVVIGAGNPLGGANNLLSFVGAAASPIDVNGHSYPAQTTDSKQYGSSQGEFWNQSVVVTVWYDQTLETLPTGEYSGGVQLSAVVVP